MLGQGFASYPVQQAQPELFIAAMSDPPLCGGVTILIVCRQRGTTVFGRDSVHALTIAPAKVALLARRTLLEASGAVCRWSEHRLCTFRPSRRAWSMRLARTTFCRGRIDR